MTDTQMMTLAFAVLVPLSLLLLSNSRVTDAKETLRADIHTLRGEIGGEIKALRLEQQMKHDMIISSLDRIALQVRAVETSLETNLKMHELAHHI